MACHRYFSPMSFNKFRSSRFALINGYKQLANILLQAGNKILKQSSRKQVFLFPQEKSKERH